MAKDSFDNYRQTYPDGHKSNHTWAGRLEKIVRAAPDKTAFIHGDKTVTWKQFDRRVNRLANALLDLGLVKEDRVAIMGFNCVEWMEAYFAAARIGAVPVNVNPRFLEHELTHILDDSDSTALIIVEDEGLEERVKRANSVRAKLPLLQHVILNAGRDYEDMHNYEGLMSKYPDTPPRLDWEVNNDDFCFLFYTGGTTGYPKGTVWDGHNRVQGLDALVITSMDPLWRRLPYLPDEAYPALMTTLPVPIPKSFLQSGFFKWVVQKVADSERADLGVLAFLGSSLAFRLAAGRMKLVAVAPLFHGAAFEGLMSMIVTMAGVGVFLENQHPFDPAELWKTVEKHKANSVIIVGDAFGVPMIEELEKNKYDISSLSVMMSYGVRFSPGLKKRFLKQLPGLLIVDGLGSTETSAAFTQVSSTGDDISLLKIKTMSQGINRSRVIDPLTGEDVKPGEKGELVLGGYCSLGYWKDPERTEKHFRVIDGRRWFYVGDEGTVDEDGYFSLIGRGSSIINTGGEKVYAEEVEEVLFGHPKIRDVGVTGVSDERWGEAVTAVIEPAENQQLGADEIIKFCADKIAVYKKPKHVLTVDALPRSATGKLLRKELKETAGKMIGKET